jgi:deoxycytidine triphosphate deaminase
MSSPRYGDLLPFDELENRLSRGEIFRSGSWSEKCIRAAGYDIRMSADLILVPDPPRWPTGRFYPKGSSRASEVILQPGDTAFVSSVEQFAMPWDICGRLGAKFGLTSKGVLTLTGVLVDPGYGMERSADGEWAAKDDERLHFLLANVGPTAVVLTPGEEKIATIQFSTCKPLPEKRETFSVGFRRIEDTFLNPGDAPSAGLVFFRHMASLATEVKGLDKRLDEVRERMAGLESGSNQVMMFGVYLLCITFLGVILAGILAVADAGEIDARLQTATQLLEKRWLFFLVFGFATVGATALLRLTVRALSNLFRRLRRGPIAID